MIGWHKMKVDFILIVKEAQGCGEGLDQRRRTMPCEIRLIVEESPQNAKGGRGLATESRETPKDVAANVPYP